MMHSPLRFYENALFSMRRLMHVVYTRTLKYSAASTSHSDKSHSMIFILWLSMFGIFLWMIYLQQMFKPSVADIGHESMFYMTKRYNLHIPCMVHLGLLFFLV